MTVPEVQLTVDAPDVSHEPGGELTGQFSIDGKAGLDVRAAELSVLWYTAGKGEEDMAVHHFERLVDEPEKPLDLRAPHRFRTKLPLSPLSYDGQIVKVCWCVRVRLFLPHGHTEFAEAAFRLGSVAVAITEREGPTADDGGPDD
jgi:hypothetical protein